MDIIKEEDWELITLVLDGEMAEQDPIFQEWLLAHKEHQSLFEELKKLRAEAAVSDKYLQFEASKGAMWQKVKAQTVAPVRKMNNWWRYAAAVLIPIAVITTWVVSQKEDSNNTKTSLSTIQLPVTKATLQLSDGKIVDLDRPNKLQEKDGTQLSAGTETGLQYGQMSIENQAPVYNTLVTAKGGAYLVTLSDGTRVWLNAVSSLTYPTRFTGKTRTVVLNGEGYFEVAKDATHPFIVQTSSSLTRVIGTAFNVYAYSDEPVAATLVEGSISFSGIAKDEAVLLKPTQQAILDNSVPGISTKNVETEVYTSWKQGELQFENERLEILLKKLDRWYGFKTSFNDASLKDLRFTGKADKTKSIEYILDLVSLTTKVRFTIKNDLVTVEKK